MSANFDTEVTILIPCLNEAESLAVVIQEARAAYDAAAIDYEILVADNGSVDGSQEIARTAGARVVEVSERGYGAALLGGISNAKGRFIVMGDADGSYKFADSTHMIPMLESEFDVVMGDRFAGGIEPGAMPWLHRRLGNPVLSWLGRLFYGIKVRDFHCGLRAFRRDSVLRLDLNSSGMEFASEMIVKASLHGLKIGEVPVTLGPDLRSRPPHLRTWRDGWRHLRFLLAFSPKWLFIVPALIAAAACILVGGIGVLGAVRAGSLELSYRSSVSAGALATVSLCSVWAFAIARELQFPRAQSSSAKIDMWTLAFLLVSLTGAAVVISQFISWSSTGFGQQEAGKNLTLTILGSTTFCIGGISFFMLILLGLVRTVRASR